MSKHMIFIHGLEGSSQGVKATILRGLYPEMLIPDFPGSLDERMAKLKELLGEKGNWTIIGSSFGGLMGTLFTCQQPERVHKLILFAPALIWPDFAANLPDPVDVPTMIYHGLRDEIIPIDVARNLAERIFRDLQFHAVDDDHGLYQTVHALDWRTLLEG